MRPTVPEPGLTKFRKELDRFLARFRESDETAPATGPESPEISLSLDLGDSTGQGEKRQEPAEKHERLEIG